MRNAGDIYPQLGSAAFRPRVSTMPTSAGGGGGLRQKVASESSSSPATSSPLTTSYSPIKRSHRLSTSGATANINANGTTAACRPTTGVTGNRLRRVRSYSVTAKGVTKFGGGGANYDQAPAARSWKQQHGAGNGHFGSHSTCSLGSSPSAGSNCSSPRHRSWSNGSSSSSFSEGNYSFASSQHNVVFIGSAEVGKTSLIAQFIASDVKDDESHEPEVRDKFISILLDGEEASLEFQDFRSASDRTNEEILHATGSEMGADAYVIVYSVADRKSFSAAMRSLATLQAADILRDKAVILVGNKIDLERCRSVSTAEGRDMATSYGCKFIETSDWMAHNVDELLVGIVNQIRLKQHVQQRLGSQTRSSSVHHAKPAMNRQPSNGSDVNKPPPPPSSPSAKNNPARQRRSRSVVRDFFRKIHFTSRSCDNLHVL